MTGLAVAAGSLGIGPSPATSSTVEDRSVEPDFRSPVRSAPDNGGAPLVAAHDNSNTEGAEWLNQNVIEGRATIICTDDSTVTAELQRAIDAWATALSNMSFNDSDGNSSGPFEHYIPTGATNSCSSNSDGADVEVRVRLISGAGAAYYSTKQANPPRKLFSARSVYQSTEYSTIVIGTVRLSTLNHELGHVLGLSDYTSCNRLRVPGSGQAATDPDPNDQHFSLMYNAPDRRCRPRVEETISSCK